ncbi:hypothetical protein CCMSSC00406_0006623 [Pleurotus cornucopiae]|uniref:Uncharacterized protein n=1 Tax=Pleurotus cornucopiae TaxID=5321 RepID=A0ACB7IQ36_PLECO|nr:hypothetical protein CCMSSC00406_0006623 [Pleurotus cornucopiae]
MAHISELFDSPVAIMDGGMGTTLETFYSKSISNTPLWSANVIMEDPEAVINAHLAFLRAGAKVILTATYQCAFETFERAGYSKDEASRVWKTGVALANEARSRFLKEYSKRGPQPKIRVALSIGPFGATPVPTQEFDGFYPPPYGPQAFPGEGLDGRNSFLPGEQAKEEEATQALAEFHLQRLKVYISDPETWAMIDCLAFETVPVVREVAAIRRAIRGLQEEYGENAMKPWWICNVFPFGKLPERHSSPREVIRAALGGTNLPRPSAVGINCCGVEFMGDISAEMAEEIGSIESTGKAPWLILYPNGGDVYDTILRQWKKGRDKAHWAEELNQVVQSVRANKAWGGVIVGGCCRTGPEEIEHLVGAIDY